MIWVCNEYVLCMYWIYCKITVNFCKLLFEKKYTQKDYLKIAVIVSIIAVPLVIAYGAAGYFDENGTKFWSEWECEQMTEFAMTLEFNKISEKQHMKYNLDMAPCIEEP